jgi:hypothetical protein
MEDDEAGTDLQDPEGPHDEMEFLTATSGKMAIMNGRSNGVSFQRKVAPALEKTTSITILPFVSTNFNCISRILYRHDIRPTDLSLKIFSFLQLVKDNWGLKIQTHMA